MAAHLHQGARVQDDDKPVILLVDDEKAILDGHRLALRREPYTVLTAASPVEALKILATRRVDVVVSDERMPKMLGSEFLHQVQKRWPRIIRILLTGQTDLETTTHAMVVGFVVLPLPPFVVKLGRGSGTQRKHASTQRVDMHERNAANAAFGAP